MWFVVDKSRRSDEVLGLENINRSEPNEGRKESLSHSSKMTTRLEETGEIEKEIERVFGSGRTREREGSVEMRLQR